MTKIIEKKEKQDVQLHIAKAFVIINEHLPDNYVQEVLEKVPTVSAGIVRNVRNKCNRITENRLNVVNALVEVALSNKKEKLKLKSLTN
ncbi:MAG: hypothetical protein H7174_07650 [Flavobacterium sp.]|nr:hypothetical protein [Flavobacterium sp.]